jgi:Protein of unknown function (DUF2892)
MKANVGMVDRIFRAVVGGALIAVAIPWGFPDTGWNWIGWIGVFPLITAAIGYCPNYTMLGISSCPARAPRR